MSGRQRSGGAAISNSPRHIMANARSGFGPRPDAQARDQASRPVAVNDDHGPSSKRRLQILALMGYRTRSGTISACRSILGIVPGDIVASETRGKLLQLSVTGVTLYSGSSSVSFMVSGNSVSKGRNAGQAAGNAEFVFYGRETHLKMRPSMPDERRLLNRAGMKDQHSNRQCFKGN